MRDADAGVRFPVGPQDLGDAIEQGAAGPGTLQLDPAGGIQQAFVMIFPMENPIAIGMDGFIDAIAVEEPVVEHGNLRVFLFHKFAVKVDFHSRPF